MIEIDFEPTRWLLISLFRMPLEWLMWHRATDVRVDQIEQARFSWCWCRVWCGYLFVVLAMLAKLMVRKESFGMYPALDKCVMPALLRCPSRPCHNDDIGISTKNKPPSLSVTYKGYNECYLWSSSKQEVPSVECPPSWWETCTDAGFIKLSD